ncbi:MAG: BREX-1 system adenine-specific DNA-methyltransferase PglX [Pseudomonadota bacterium]
MAFDQATRNKLQKFVSDARALLTEEFTRQLQNDYGMDPDTGAVSPIDNLPQLTDAQHQTAKLLRETMAHYQASGSGNDAKEVLGRIVREQAFTVLNRLCALRMAEARGILMESIAKGYNSKGFQLYARVAGTALGESGDTYRNYLFSVFDEFSVDLAVLFDRYSTMGRLFPKETALMALLHKINDVELESLWAEDETIGWIYQYFNSKEERKKMRDESQAPRNSRELAVRNQFFTPRYVVEFLTDNTLGRIWYEMTKGNTILKDQCRYLVRRPNEIFLQKGEKAPEQKDNDEDLSQEELLRQPVYIEHRPMKDPREILMLDPACGSMHFGLYAFDLFEKIYEEAWDLQSTGQWHNADNHKLVLLTEIYKSKDELLRDIPRLIIENNIHGIDIDPRAVQIAGLSLWLRAQRSWKNQNIKPTSRPQIKKSNIVCAEPMPGEKEFLKAFSENLKPRVLGQLVEIIFEKLELAGEAGSLLKIEEEIADAVEQAREEFNKELLRRKENAGFLPGMAPKVQQRELFDFSDLPDKTQFWQTAEEKILDALKNYAEQTEGEDGSRLRLFVEDAAKGFAFIDICRKRYDVVLMNPPFGNFSKPWTSKSKIAYPNSSNDILGAFIERLLDRLYNKGRLGAITSRTCFFLTTFKNWRRNVILKESMVSVIADLGQGVMDDAMVEAAAYVLERTRQTSSMPVVIRAIADDDRQRVLEACLDAHQAGKPESRLFLAHQQTFDLLQDSPFVYWIDAETLHQFEKNQHFEPEVGLARNGMTTGDDPRWVRTVWEVAPQDTIFCYYPSDGSLFCSFDDPIVQSFLARRDQGEQRWGFFVKAGASQPWYSPITLKVNWAENGKELKNFRNNKGKPRSFLRSQSLYHRPGFSWTRRAVRFYPYLVPSNCLPSVSRYMAFPNHGMQTEALVVCASRLVSSFLRFYGEKFEFPNFLVDTLKALPWPKFAEETKKHFNVLVSREVKQRRLAYQNHEPFHEFLLPVKIRDFSNGGKSLSFEPESLIDDATEKMVADAFGFSDEQARSIERDLLEAIAYQKNAGATETSCANEEDVEEKSDYVLDYSAPALHEAHLSYLVGISFGRWDIRYATGDLKPPELPDPFDPLPVCPPGMLQNTIGLPAAPKDVQSDYPLRISWSGIIVCNEGHSEDIISHIREAIEIIWKDKASEIEQEACGILGMRDLREYFAKPNKFFADHLKRYSKSRRQAPIYWPLSTPSGSYTLWLYYHRLTDQTLYTCVNNFVGPKLKQVAEDADTLRKKSNRTSQEEKDLEKLSDLELELKDFQAELLRIAKFWKPNLNDGVQITAAPLWKLFQHKPWQKTLKQTWEDLEKGKYDWAHLAYSVWPERVIPDSHKDRSYAIAHDLESDLWEEIETGTDRQGNPKTKWVPKDLDEKQLKQFIAQKMGGNG